MYQIITDNNVMCCYFCNKNENIHTTLIVEIAFFSLIKRENQTKSIVGPGMRFMIIGNVKKQHNLKMLTSWTMFPAVLPFPGPFLPTRNGLLCVKVFNKCMCRCVFLVDKYFFV